MGNQSSTDEEDYSEVAQKPQFQKSNDIYDVEKCPEDLDFDIVVEQSVRSEPEESRKLTLQRLHYMLSAIDIGDIENNITLDEILDEFRDWPLSRKYYNREATILCDLAELIVSNGSINLLIEIIDDIMMRAPYVKKTGAKCIVQLFELLVQVQMYDHANQILYDLINLPEVASIKEKPFTYTKTLLPQMATSALKHITIIQIPTYIESTVMKYIGSVNWEISTKTSFEDFATIGQLVSAAREVNSKNLLETLINIVEYDIPAFRKSEDILEAYFIIMQQLNIIELHEIPIIEFIVKYMSKEHFTYQSVGIFLKYFKTFCDNANVHNEPIIFYPLIKEFINVYLPKISQDWPDDIPYPNLAKIIYGVRMIRRNNFANEDFINDALLKLIRASLINIDNKDIQLEIYWIAVYQKDSLCIPVLKILYDANWFTDRFGDILFDFVMYSQEDYSKDVEFVQQCIMAMMLQPNLHYKLVHALFHIVTKKTLFDKFEETAFQYLKDCWYEIVPNRETNRQFLKKMNELLVDQQAVLKYASLIQRANEYIDTKK